MRRIRSIILTMMLILTTTLFSRVPVLAAANISVSVNKSNVKVGDTVTVTLSITSGYGAQGVLKKVQEYLAEAVMSILQLELV